MNYEEAMEYLNESYKFSKKSGLDRMIFLMDFLGNPQDKLKFIHVTGTNGKGSTCSYISNILKNCGLKVGIFTSPYIHRFSERIKINNLEISNEEISNYISEIEQKTKELNDIPTYFEILTAMAFLHFSRNNCDIVVLEVGIGGLLDSTNIIKDSEVSVITNIGLDHKEILGDTIEEITKQKAGIIKQNGNVVLYPCDNYISSIINEVCLQKNANLYKVNLKNLENVRSSIYGQEFNYKDINNIKIGLLGDYQIYNALVAIETINVLIKKGYKITLENIKNGLINTRWPARFEILNKSPVFILDGAHNVQGVKSLVYNLKRYFNNKTVIFIVGALKNKDYKNFIDITKEIASIYLTITPKSYKAIDSKTLEQVIKNKGLNSKSFYNINDAIIYALNICNYENIICAFGSLYLAGDIRSFFNLK